MEGGNLDERASGGRSGGAAVTFKKVPFCPSDVHHSREEVLEGMLLNGNESEGLELVERRDGSRGDTSVATTPFSAQSHSGDEEHVCRKHSTCASCSALAGSRTEIKEDRIQSEEVVISLRGIAVEAALKQDDGAAAVGRKSMVPFVSLLSDGFRLNKAASCDPYLLAPIKMRNTAAELEPDSQQIVPPSTEQLSWQANTAPSKVTVTACRLGQFRFKGSNELVSIVNFLPQRLLSRRFPTDPPSGKGLRITVGHGAVTSGLMPVLDIVQEYRRLFLQQSSESSFRVSSVRKTPLIASKVFRSST
ncbi:hypothetical protein CEUSTIGMA_g13969.t1 [Chlamydomonas eustigma]|uniref:Uncharacterized protein n=1 Tax=Chlamydomonas eustigma TaxID=1157962 RepID=A0A250XUG5_9CHLO|nr:hypothetical protein CEUSTIGMA_g13969.t1 [Chlamydomonas eustigma]|eukprot:GAX86562.1 hypothetical protein CEUSTIGMA_g13969.t1 [Chlamydomonas eustigma]